MVLAKELVAVGGGLDLGENVQYVEAVDNGHEGIEGRVIAERLERGFLRKKSTKIRAKRNDAFVFSTLYLFLLELLSRWETLSVRRARFLMGAIDLIRSFFALSTLCYPEGWAYFCSETRNM